MNQIPKQEKKKEAARDLNVEQLSAEEQTQRDADLIAAQALAATVDDSLKDNNFKAQIKKIEKMQAEDMEKTAAQKRSREAEAALDTIEALLDIELNKEYPNLGKDVAKDTITIFFEGQADLMGISKKKEVQRFVADKSWYYRKIREKLDVKVREKIDEYIRTAWDEVRKKNEFGKPITEEQLREEMEEVTVRLRRKVQAEEILIWFSNEIERTRFRSESIPHLFEELKVEAGPQTAKELQKIKDMAATDFMDFMTAAARIKTVLETNTSERAQTLWAKMILLLLKRNLHFLLNVAHSQKSEEARTRQYFEFVDDKYYLTPDSSFHFIADVYKHNPDQKSKDQEEIEYTNESDTNFNAANNFFTEYEPEIARRQFIQTFDTYAEAGTENGTAVWNALVDQAKLEPYQESFRTFGHKIARKQWGPNKSFYSAGDYRIRLCHVTGWLERVESKKRLPRKYDHRKHLKKHTSYPTLNKYREN